MPFFRIYGYTLDKNDNIVWEGESIFVCENYETWKTIIAKFIYFVNRANSMGYYGGYDWFVEIREMQESQSHELYPQTLILRMDKQLYQKYKDIYDYPIRPVFTTYNTFDCYELRIYENKVDYDVFFDSNGMCQRFECEWNAWKYIFQNDLI